MIFLPWCGKTCRTFTIFCSNFFLVSCKLIGADFTNTQAKNVQFHDCDLSNSIFENTNLENANLSTSYSFDINPSKNKLKKANFSKDNIIGLLKSTGIIIKR